MRCFQQCDSGVVQPLGPSRSRELPVKNPLCAGRRVSTNRGLKRVSSFAIFTAIAIGGMSSIARGDKSVQVAPVPPVPVLQPRAVQNIQIQVRGVAVEAVEAAEVKKKRPANSQPATSEATTESNSEQPKEKDDPHSTSKLLDKLEAIENEIARLQGLPAPGRRTQGVVLLVDSTHSGVANYYSSTPTRYLVTRLWVVNLGDAEVTVRPLEIELLTNGDRLNGKERAGVVENEGVQVDGNHQQVRNLKTEESLTVPAGGRASTWVVISNLPVGAFIPEMTLEVPVGEVRQSFDLTEFERGRLAMTVERIGPKGALAVLSIGGELNSVNVGRLTGELESLGGIGVSRAVVTGTESMPALQNGLQNWLAQARNHNPNNRQFNHLPTFSASLREVHISGIKGAPSEIAGLSTHATSLEAVSAALRTAYEVLPPDQILTSIRTGDVRTRSAALEHGSRQLTQEAVPYLLKLTRDEDPAIRRAAVAALVNFGTQDVIDRLMQVAFEDPEPFSTAALRSLAGSRFPKSHDALTLLLGQESKISQTRLIRILGEHPRPQWADTVYGLTRSSDMELRKTATETLIRIGHKELFTVLEEALNSEYAPLQNVAYQHVASQLDRRSEDLAINHVIRRLETSPMDSTTQQLIQRTRDQRVVPLLQKQLEDEKSDKSSIIQVLMYIGDQTVAQDLVNRFSKLKDNEKSSVLGQMQNLQPDLAVKLARQSIASSNTSVIHQSCNILAMHDACDETVALLEKALKAADKNNGSQSAICNALGMIGSEAAKKVLVEARDGEEKNLSQYATNGLRQMRNLLPGTNYVNMANYYLNQANDLKNAETHLKYAFKIDPEMPEAFDVRAKLRLKQGKYEESIADATQAIKLDATLPEPHSTLGQAYFNQDKYTEAIPHLKQAMEMNHRDHMMVTSLGIALAMTDQGAEGIKIALKWKLDFEGQGIYNYNVGCVYARAAEKRKPTEPTPKNPDGKDPKVSEWQEAAIKYLQKSVDQGFRDFKHIQNDPDLKSLHHIPEFRQLSKLDEPLPMGDDLPSTEATDGDAPAKEKQEADDEKAEAIKEEVKEPEVIQFQQAVRRR